MSFDIQQFSGFTADVCVYGGFSVSIMMNETHLGGNSTITMADHGPLCVSAPNIPFIGGKIRSLTFPRGTHRLTVYAYSDLFNIDMSVEVTRGECTSITNICAMALQRYLQHEYMTWVHNHVDATRLRYSTIIAGIFSVLTVNIDQRFLLFFVFIPQIRTFSYSPSRIIFGNCLHLKNQDIVVVVLQFLVKSRRIALLSHVIM